MLLKVTRNRQKGDPCRRGWDWCRIREAHIIFAGPLCVVFARRRP